MVHMDPATGSVKLGRLDGNALAGVLGDLFRVDMTLAIAECGSCGWSAPLATVVVEMDDAAAIARCPSCRRTLLTLLRTDAGTRLAFDGLSALTL